MAIIKPRLLRLTDLIVHEYEPAIGSTRKVIKVNAGTNATTLPLGTVVTRVKGVTDTPYKPVVAADLTLNNEFAILIGDRLEINDPIEFVSAAQDATAKTNALALVQGQLTVKRAKIAQANPALTVVQLDSLAHLFEAQEIIIEQSI